MSYFKHFLVLIITPAVPHGTFKMKVAFCVTAVFAPVLANTRSQFAETSRGGGSVAFRPPSDGRKSTVSSGGPAGAAIQLERFVGDHPDRRER